MKKRILALAAVLAVCLTLLSIATLADTTPEEYFTFSNGTITKYTGGDEDVVIPSFIDGKAVTTIGEEAFAGTGVKTVVLPWAVSWIETNAFYGCASLEYIDIPAKVISIGYCAFMDCTSLKTAIIRAEKLSSLPGYMFSGCSALESVILPSGIKTIENDVFMGCSSLKTVTVPAGVKRISSEAFYGCQSLVYADLPDSVKSIGESAFQSCPLLECPNLANVTSIEKMAFSGGMFRELVLPSNVETVGEKAFQGVPLTEVTIEGCPTFGENVFQPVDSVPPCTLNLPETWTEEDPVSGSGISWLGGTFNVRRSGEKKITVLSDGHGTAEADAANAAAGTEVTLTAEPADGYVFNEWIVLGGGVTVEDDQFTVGTEDVTVIASFKEAAAHQHVPTLVSGQAPTAAADGWKDYYQCSDATCNKIFSDPACTTEITDLAAWKSGDGKLDKLTPHEHTFSGEWSMDAAAHWHASTCLHDGYSVYKDRGAHDFDGGAVVPGGIKYTCEVCGYEKTVWDSGEDCGHENLLYMDNKNGTHKTVCADCMETLNPAAPCVYDRESRRCVCGARESAVGSVKIGVDVREKTQKQFVGFWLFGYYKDVTTYTATIKASAVGTRITKVQYRLNGGKWTEGTSVSSDKPIKTLLVKVWDSTGKVCEYTYEQ